MNQGLDGFKELLSEFKQLAIWAAGGSAVPFAADLLSLSPPWPQGIVVVTSLIELVTLVLVYQLLKFSGKRIVNSVLIAGTIAIVLLGASYLYLNSLYTYQVPYTNQRFVKGYVCTNEAMTVFKDKCPTLSLYDLSTANYEAESLWTEESIARMRLCLVVLWLSAFVALSMLFGSFIVYQAQISGDQKPKRSDA